MRVQTVQTLSETRREVRRPEHELHRGPTGVPARWTIRKILPLGTDEHVAKTAVHQTPFLLLRRAVYVLARSYIPAERAPVFGWHYSVPETDVQLLETFKSW